MASIGFVSHAADAAADGEFWGIMGNSRTSHLALKITRSATVVRNSLFLASLTSFALRTGAEPPRTLPNALGACRPKSGRNPRDVSRVPATRFLRPSVCRLTEGCGT